MLPIFLFTTSGDVGAAITTGTLAVNACALIKIEPDNVSVLGFALTRTCT